MKIIVSCLIVFLLTGTTISQNKREAILHSHNDYENRIPLFDALNYGFRSIEVDIHLDNNELYVAHDSNEIDKSKTLDKLYLIPLWELFKKLNADTQEQEPLLILIDIKTEANSTYSKLREVLAKYKEMLTTFSDYSKKNGFVTVIVSGNRPIEHMKIESPRLTALDGRLEDLGKNYNQFLIPLVSESASEFASFDYKGALSKTAYEELKKFVDSAHNQNRLTRLWGVPDSKVYWKLQFEIGFDLIGTNNLEELSNYYNQWKKDNNE